jgi:hypothetical protein
VVCPYRFSPRPAAASSVKPDLASLGDSLGPWVANFKSPRETLVRRHRGFQAASGTSIALTRATRDDWGSSPVRQKEPCHSTDRLEDVKKPASPRPMSLRDTREVVRPVDEIPLGCSESGPTCSATAFEDCAGAYWVAQRRLMVLVREHQLTLWTGDPGEGRHPGWAAAPVAIRTVRILSTGFGREFARVRRSHWGTSRSTTRVSQSYCS